MRAQRKFTDDGAALQYFFVEFLVFFGIADVNARPENPNGAAMGIHRSLMPYGVDAAGQAADDDQSAGCKVMAEPLGHLCAVKRRATRAHDADAGQVQNLWIASDIKQDRRGVNLQKCLGILLLRPVEQRTACDLSNACQLLLGALEGLLLHYGLGDLAWEMARFKIGQRDAGDALPRDR